MRNLTAIVLACTFMTVTAWGQSVERSIGKQSIVTCQVDKSDYNHNSQRTVRNVSDFSLSRFSGVASGSATGEGYEYDLHASGEDLYIKLKYASYDGQEVVLKEATVPLAIIEASDAFNISLSSFSGINNQYWLKVKCSGLTSAQAQ